MFNLILYFYILTVRRCEVPTPIRTKTNTLISSQALLLVGYYLQWRTAFLQDLRAPFAEWVFNNANIPLFYKPPIVLLLKFIKMAYRRQ